jgi:hypothetical protein
VVGEPLAHAYLGPDGGYRDLIAPIPEGSGITPGSEFRVPQERQLGQALGAYSVPGSAPCILGFDPSPSKLGWGVVRDDGGEPVDCGVEQTDGAPENIRRALTGLDRVLRARGLEPCFGYMEKPGGRGASGGFDEGVACGMVWALARSVWPWLTIDWTTTSHWRSVVGIPTQAPSVVVGDSRRRRWLKDRSVERAQALGFQLPESGKRVVRPSDDAAEGGLIARAAWVDLEANPEWRVAA